MLEKIPFQYRITLLYIFFGALWIIFTDILVVDLTADPHQFQMFSTYKGWFFVLVTGLLLFFLVSNEIKRRTRIYNQLLEANRKAVESDRLKTNFLSNLSHYIRTPMNGILGFVQLLEDKDTSPEKHQLFLSYINESSQHLLQTLNSIIEISRIQEGQVKVTRQEIFLNELIDRIASIARVDILGKGKEINVFMKHGLLDGNDGIISDKNKITQILSNLMDNAITFTEKGEIEIGYSVMEKDLLFWVKDTGRGIPEERKELLFTEFLHDTSTTFTIDEGAGLGLALSSRFSRLLGGDLWLEDTSEKGSKFCFTIPFTSVQ